MLSLLTIRTAVPSDIDAIATLLTELNAEEGYDVCTDPIGLHDALFGDVRAVKLSALVSEQNHNIVAVALYYPGYDTLSASIGYHLADMVVTHDARRKGIGRKLVSTIAGTCIKENKQWLSLTVLRDNSAACAFYKSLGLTHVGVDFYAGGATLLTRLSAEAK